MTKRKTVTPASTDAVDPMIDGPIPVIADAPPLSIVGLAQALFVHAGALAGAQPGEAFNPDQVIVQGLAFDGATLTLMTSHGQTIIAPPLPERDAEAEVEARGFV